MGDIWHFSKCVICECHERMVRLSTHSDLRQNMRYYQSFYDLDLIVSILDPHSRRAGSYKFGAVIVNV